MKREASRCVRVETSYTMTMIILSAGTMGPGSPATKSASPLATTIAEQRRQCRRNNHQQHRHSRCAPSGCVGDVGRSVKHRPKTSRSTSTADIRGIAFQRLRFSISSVRHYLQLNTTPQARMGRPRVDRPRQRQRPQSAPPPAALNRPARHSTPGHRFATAGPNAAAGRLRRR